MGTYKGASYYDMHYDGSKGSHYLEPASESRYYPMWIKVRNLLESIDHPKNKSRNYILEIGCGVGQFCEVLNGAYPYLGIDFSKTGIEFAKTKKIGRFLVCDVEAQRLPPAYEVVICLETLEHLQDDLAVLAKIKKGAYVICSVPNFNYASHVRHFKKIEYVTERYEGLIDFHKIFSYSHFHIFKGIKK